MANHSNHAEEEKPLDPAAERLRRRMIRLLIVSLGIMMAGLMAVFVAVVYRVGEIGEGSMPPQQAVQLPEGAVPISADLDGGRVLLLVRNPQGGFSMLVHDLAEGKVTATIDVR